MVGEPTRKGQAKRGKKMDGNQSIGKTNPGVCEYEAQCRNGIAVHCEEQEKPLYLGECSILRRRWKDRLSKARIGERYWKCTPDRVVADTAPLHLRKQVNAIVEYRENLIENFREGMGLILMGPVGTMKTTAAVSVLMESLSQGLGGYFIVSASLLDEIFTLKASNMEEWVAFERRLKETSLLVWDDLGAEYSEGWVQTKVDAIISERYNHNKPTILTTNLSSEELKGRYAERVIDRLRGTCQVITFAGKSLRGAKS